MAGEVEKIKIKNKALFSALFLIAILYTVIFILIVLPLKNIAAEPSEPELEPIEVEIADNKPPTIELLGKSKSTILKGDKYEEAGFTVFDDRDEMTEESVTIRGAVDPNAPGEYEIIYMAQDKTGNTAKAKRTIIVKDDYTFDTDDADFYWRTLVNYIEKSGWKVSVGYYNFEKAAERTYNENQLYYGASLVKAAGALYTYERMNLTDELRSLVKKAITLSDNDAYMSLYKLLGGKNLKNFGAELGMDNFLKSNESIEYGNTDVHDQLILWRNIYDFLYNNQDDKRRELISFFNNRNTNSLAFNDDVEVLHKYGFWESACHDSGLVLADSPYVVTILTAEGRGGFSKIKDLSEKIYRLNELIVES